MSVAAQPGTSVVLVGQRRPSGGLPAEEAEHRGPAPISVVKRTVSFSMQAESVPSHLDVSLGSPTVESEAMKLPAHAGRRVSASDAARSSAADGSTHSYAQKRLRWSDEHGYELVQVSAAAQRGDTAAGTACFRLALLRSHRAVTRLCTRPLHRCALPWYLTVH